MKKLASTLLCSFFTLGSLANAAFGQFLKVVDEDWYINSTVGVVNSNEVKIGGDSIKAVFSFQITTYALIGHVEPADIRSFSLFLYRDETLAGADSLAMIDYTAIWNGTRFALPTPNITLYRDVFGEFGNLDMIRLGWSDTSSLSYGELLLEMATNSSIENIFLSSESASISPGGGAQMEFSTAPIPEPSSFAALAGLGVLGFAATRRQKR